MPYSKMGKSIRTILSFFYVALLVLALVPIQVVNCPQNQLSKYAVVGCLANSAPPYNLSYYVDRFGDLFRGYYAYDMNVENLEGAAKLNKFALSHPNITLYVQVTLPSCNIFNESMLSSLEDSLKLFISKIDSPNIKYVEISGLLQEWTITWTHEPTIQEIESWQKWQKARGLMPIPYAPFIESYAPLFAQWAIDLVSNITTRFISAAKLQNPGKFYGFVQYDCVALDASGRIWDLYSFCKKAKPGFVVTHNLALVERSKDGKVIAVILNAPMSSGYRNALGNIELYSPVLMAGVSTSAGDDAYTSYYKYALTEMSTYLNGFYPIILLGPQQKEQLAEFMLNVALYGVPDVPVIEGNSASVLVVRPTYAVGRLSKTSMLQQTLMYSLVTLDVPFVYVSESYVYNHPDELKRYSYVIYASSQITPQMSYILNNLPRNITTVGLREIGIGLFYSDLPGLDSVKFTRTLDNFSAVCIHSVFTNTSLEMALKGDRRVLHYGTNTLRWETAYVYVNDQRIDYFLDDILGYSPYFPILVNVAIVSIVGGGAFAFFMRFRHKRSSSEV